MIPYAPNGVLFADYAAKHRFIYTPSAAKITYSPTEPWTFPEGSIIVKTFAQPRDLRDVEMGEQLIETRLLIFQEGQWKPHTYLWNDEQNEASRTVAGAAVPVTWIHSDGTTRSNTFAVPNSNQCLNCHGKPGVTNLIGVRTRQLNRDFDYGDGPVNQIDHLVSLQQFDGAIEDAAAREVLPEPFGTASLADRARAYLEVNCAHCHNPSGAAKDSGLFLSSDITEPVDFGICRRPVAAGSAAGGNLHDIQPGAPDESILVFRMDSADAEVRMPELGRNQIDDEAVELIREWITAMPADDCSSK